MSLADRDKAIGHRGGAPVPRGRASRSSATAGTADALEADGIPVDDARGQGRASPPAPTPSSSSPPARSQLVVNSPRGRGARADGAHIRAGGRGAGDPVPHHRGRGAGGGQRHPRLGRPRAHACARCRSSTPASTCDRPRTLAARGPLTLRGTGRTRRRRPRRTTVGSVTLPEPGPHRVGHRRPRRRAGALRRPRLARRRRREVAVRRSRGRATRRCGCTRPPAG